MGLAARPVAGMALMQVGFVVDLKAFGTESRGQLSCDDILDAHGRSLTRVAAVASTPGWRRDRREYSLEIVKLAAHPSKSA